MIGDTNEPCFLAGWYHSLQSLKKRIEIIANEPLENSFKRYSEREILELIIKSNQLEDDFDEKYKNLPKLDKSLWEKYYCSIDETMDAYKIVIIKEADKLKFIWEGWRSPCPDHELGKLHSVMVDAHQVGTTINEALTFLQGKL